MTGAAARRLSNWHHFIAGTAVSVAAAVMVGTTAVGAITVATTATTIAVGNTAVGTIAAAIAVGTTAASTVAICACRDIIAAAASRGSGEGGSKGRGGAIGAATT